MYWRGGTRLGAMAGLLVGFVTRACPLMLSPIAKSGWWPTDFQQRGPCGTTGLKPEQRPGWAGPDMLTHSLFRSLTVNQAACGDLPPWRGPPPAETSQALLWVEPFTCNPRRGPVFRRSRARVQDLLELAWRFLGAARAQALFADCTRRTGVEQTAQIVPDALLVLPNQAVVLRADADRLTQVVRNLPANAARFRPRLRDRAAGSCLPAAA